MTETTGALAKALAAFQAEMPVVAKGKKATVPTKAGGQYSYTYADLADVTDAAMPILTKHGLAFSCSPRQTERGYELVGRLLHSSGESLEGALPINGATPQEMGSSLTYMRRYLLGSMTGIVTDDDDDGQLAQSAAKRAAAKKVNPEPHANAITEGQVKAMGTLMTKLGMTDRDLALEYVTKAVGRNVESRNDLSASEATVVLDSLKADLEGART